MKKAPQDFFEPGMPDVPSDWAVLPFEQAVDVISDKGKRVKQRSYLPAGKIPVIDQGQDTIGGYTNDENMAFDDGLPVILFGDHTRSLKYIDKRFAMGAEGVKILRPREGYAPKFFYYLLRSLQIPSRGYSRHFQFLRKFHFPLPPELQQKSIVAEIEKQFSRLDEAVVNLKRVKANLKRYKAAVLKAAVEGKLTEDWRKQHPNVEPASKLLERILAERRAKWKGRGKYKEPVVVDTSGLPDLPKGWVWASVESLSTKVVDGVHKKPDYVSAGVPFVTVRNLTAGPGINLEVLNYVTKEDHEAFSKRADPEQGDILISKDGTLGVVRVIRTRATFSIFVSVALIKPVLKQMSDYLGVALLSPQVQMQMVPKGSGLQHIHLEDLRTDCVPVPPLEEQQQIVAEVERRLSVIDELEAAVQANLTRADRLRQAILQKAFSGRLIGEKGYASSSSSHVSMLAAEGGAPYGERP